MKKTLLILVLVYYSYCGEMNCDSLITVKMTDEEVKSKLKDNIEHIRGDKL